MKVCSNFTKTLTATVHSWKGAWRFVWTNDENVKSLHSWFIQCYTKSKLTSGKKDQLITKHIFHKVYQPHNKVFNNKDFKCTLMNNGKTLEWCLVTWVEELCCIWLGLLPTRRWGYDYWWRKKPFGLTKSTFMSHNIKMSLWYKRWKNCIDGSRAGSMNIHPPFRLIFFKLANKLSNYMYICYKHAQSVCEV